ncbi:hypothetical protein [Photorhabdus viridis]|uniref:hypothetical protein n=1 Tax=Photorhabdus viridis TaxID=3163327 RepID=UPI0033073F12
MIKKYLLYGSLALFFLFPRTGISASEQERLTLSEPDYSLRGLGTTLESWEITLND